MSKTMTKTPDEVKKALRIHIGMHNGCVGCPYGKIGNQCTAVMLKDVLSYIKQLEEGILVSAKRMSALKTERFKIINMIGQIMAQTDAEIETGGAENV